MSRNRFIVQNIIDTRYDKSRYIKRYVFYRSRTLNRRQHNSPFHGPEMLLMPMKEWMRGYLDPSLSSSRSKSHDQPWSWIGGYWTDEQLAMNGQILVFKAAENAKSFGETATDINNAQMGSSHFDIFKRSLRYYRVRSNYTWNTQGHLIHTYSYSEAELTQTSLLLCNFPKLMSSLSCLLAGYWQDSQFSSHPSDWSSC